MKKGMLCALIFSLVALIQAPEAESAQKRLSILTGGTAGIYFPIGGAMAKAVSKAGDLQATAESSNASVFNVNLLSKYEAEMAFVQNDVTAWAFKGEHMFDKPMPNLRTVVSIYPEHVHLVTAKDSGIKSLADLKGKRVSVGPPNSGYEADARILLQLAGMSFNDFNTSRLSAADSAARYKDNQIDAAFMTIGYPAPAPMDMNTSKPISLVHFDKAFLDKLVATHPYFVASIIPAGTYQGVDTDTPCPAVMALIVTHDKMSDDTVYAFLKNLFDNLPDVHISHAKAKELSLENALRGIAAAPLHPGAAKFYKEKGLTLPAGAVVGK